MFTLFGRLKTVLASKAGRRHLINTWKWSFGQAWRAISGIQVSEVLDELRLISREFPETDFHAQSKIDSAKFIDVAKKHRAGKQSSHGQVYSMVGLEPSEVEAVLEIGIGSNNPKMPSSMGRSGVPGASLLLWREIFPKAQVIGADFDRNTLLDADRITCFFVDSTSSQSIENMRQSISQRLEINQFDLIVDDGLHTPEANLRNFRVLQSSIRPGGFYVIEDIDAAWAPMFDIFGRGLNNFDSKLVFSDKQKNHGFLILRKKASKNS